MVSAFTERGIYGCYRLGGERGCRLKSKTPLWGKLKPLKKTILGLYLLLSSVPLTFTYRLISYFLFLISYFLYLISYFLFLISYFLFFISYILFLISYFLFFISYILFLIFLFLISYFLYLRERGGFTLNFNDHFSSIQPKALDFRKNKNLFCMFMTEGTRQQQSPSMNFLIFQSNYSSGCPNE